MIVFDLKCNKGHVFEAWFRSSAAYEQQRAQGLVACPHCNNTDIIKAVMAPNVTAKSNQKPDVPQSVKDTTKAPEDTVPENTVPENTVPENTVPEDTLTENTPAPSAPPLGGMGPVPNPDMTEKAQTLLEEFRKSVEENCDDVGKDFAEEARKIHYGEADERGIYGESTVEETMELIEEGIDVMPLPVQRRTDA